MALHGLHHLLHHVLRALPQGLDGAALIAHGRAALAFAQIAFGIAHGLARFAELLGGLQAHAFHGLLHSLQALLQGFLALAQRFHSIRELFRRHRLARLGGLSSLRLLALLLLTLLLLALLAGRLHFGGLRSGRLALLGGLRIGWVG